MLELSNEHATANQHQETSLWRHDVLLTLIRRCVPAGLGYETLPGCCFSYFEQVSGLWKTLDIKRFATTQSAKPVHREQNNISPLLFFW